MNITTSIKTVKDSLREWQGQRGLNYAVEGSFENGGDWEASHQTPEKARETMEVMKGLIGIDHEFEVDDKTRQYQGRTQYRLKNWPGKPQYSGGGGGGRSGGGSFQTQYRNSEQGAKEERDSIARSVALQQAVVFIGSDSKEPGEVLSAADRFYEWLVKNNKPVSQAFQQAANTEATTPVTAGTQSKIVQKANTLFNEPDKPAPPAGGYKTMTCPKCGKPEAVRKSKLDGTPPWYCYSKIGGCGHQWGDTQPLTSDAPVEHKSPAVLASEQIALSVKKGDMTHLKKVMERIAERVIDGGISQAEADELDIETQTAKKAIESGQSYNEWYQKMLQAVQNRESETHPDMQELEKRF